MASQAAEILRGIGNLPGQIIQALSRVTFVRFIVVDRRGQPVSGAGVKLTRPGSSAPPTGSFVGNPLSGAGLAEFVFFGGTTELAATVTGPAKTITYHPQNFILRWQGDGAA